MATAEDNPAQRPPRMVANERLVPGMSAAHWQSPIHSACFGVTFNSLVLSEGILGNLFSAKKMTNPPMIKARATMVTLKGM